MPVRYEERYMVGYVTGDAVLRELCDNNVSFTNFQIDGKIRVEYGHRYKFKHTLPFTPKYAREIVFGYRDGNYAVTVYYRDAGRFTVSL